MIKENNTLENKEVKETKEPEKKTRGRKPNVKETKEDEKKENGRIKNKFTKEKS